MRARGLHAVAGNRHLAPLIEPQLPSRKPSKALRFRVQTRRFCANPASSRNLAEVRGPTYRLNAFKHYLFTFLRTSRTRRHIRPRGRTILGCRRPLPTKQPFARKPAVSESPLPSCPAFFGTLTASHARICASLILSAECRVCGIVECDRLISPA